MKLILLLLPLIFLSSCTKEEDYSNMPVYLPGDISNGYISMKKNNREMMARATSFRCSKDDSLLALLFVTVDQEGVLAEWFSLHCIQLNLEIQELCKLQDINCLSTMNYVTLHDDQILDKYILNLSRNNFIQITKIDSTEGWINGKMEMHFDRDKSKPKVDANNPEKVSFTEGEFRIKLPD